MKQDYKEHSRLIFRDTIQKSLIGPGSDVFGLEDDIEIISDYPLKRYYSGVLFPERTSKGDTNTTGAIADSDANSQYSDDSINNIEVAQEIEKNLNYDKATDTDLPSKAKSEKQQEDYSEANHYFPSNMGLTFCIDKSVKKVKSIFSFGKYYQPEILSETKILIEKSDFEILAFNQTYPLDEYLQFDGNYMFFKTIGSDSKESKLRKLTVYNINQIFNENEEIKNSAGLKKVELLLGRVWKRKRIEPIEKEIDVSSDGYGDINGYDVLSEGKDENIHLIKYFKLVHTTDYGKYVKILIANKGVHPRNRFSNANEKLNQLCLFQTSIIVKDSKIKPYKPVFDYNPFDSELNTINYQYRKILSFGIGHGCAVKWNNQENPDQIETTFSPEVDIKHFSNDFRKDFSDELKDITIVRNLTIWSALSEKEVINKLYLFADTYEKWIIAQKSIAKNEKEYQTVEFKKIYNEIINCQTDTLERLRKNIKLLNDNNLVWKSFQLANTSMYIQMIISRDNSFGLLNGKPKELDFFETLLFKHYNTLEIFQNYTGKEKPQYRPFQLAFLLLNLESTINESSLDRNNKVDLLWFPTGGGKTEAYLALTAFTIIFRRLQHPDYYQGVSVIMRYTLRLLTAQQFERASKLICALEFLRYCLENDKKYCFGKDKISLGMWVGSATTPNTYGEAMELNKEIDQEKNKLNQGKGSYKKMIEMNTYPVTSCPWCGCNLISKNPTSGYYVSGYQAIWNPQNNSGSFKTVCINKHCHFSNELPLYFVDDSVYENRPTLLFATVDKFAMLSHREEGHQLFNSLDSNKLAPDLIIQDELHLLSGPLGSITGLFETIVELLCTKGDRKPKIIASTATTRNTKYQIEMLYGNRNLNIFPPSGITYDDNFFSFVSEKSLRKHIGFMATGKTTLDTQIQLLAHLLLARIELYKDLKHQLRNLTDDQVKGLIDFYWTIVAYYNSLKDVGKTYNKIGAEILALLRLLHNRHDITRLWFGFNYYGLSGRTRELTSRIESQKIKSLLNELDETFQLKTDENGTTFIDKTVDIVLASNMFSVGIDVKRLNVMLMNGQPRNVAEYIQASSRVGREKEGIVFNLLDANRARDKSYFENFTTFNNSYYKFVEPLSVTPFTEIALDKAINSLLVCYVRHKYGNLSDDDSAKDYKGDIIQFKEFISNRIKDESQRNYAISKIEALSRNWQDKIKNIDKLKYKKAKQPNFNLIQKPALFDEWSLMQSMREIDTNSLIKIIND